MTQIANSWLVPGIYVEVQPQGAGGVQQQRSLLVGQKLSAGSATANVPILITSQAQAQSQFGRASMLERMVWAFLAQHPNGELWALPLDDPGGGVQATGTIAVSGTATESGTLYLYIAGQLVEVAVTSGDDATAIGDAIATAINAEDDLPVTASALTGTVTLTARHAGTIGNTIPVQINVRGQAAGEETPAGVTITITAMSGGSGDPDPANAIAAMGDSPFDYVAVPWDPVTSSSLMDDFDDEMERRWTPEVGVYGHVFTAEDDTVGNLSTSGNAQNSRHRTDVGCYQLPHPPYETAAAVCGIVHRVCEADPGIPVHGAEIDGFLPPPIQYRFTQSERNTLLNDGIAPLYESGGALRLDKWVTTYQQNDAGAPDTSYRAGNTGMILTRMARDFVVAMGPIATGKKLVNDGTRLAPGQNAVTPSIVKGLILAKAREWESQAWLEDYADFADRLVVQRNQTNTDRVDCYLYPNVGNRVEVLAATISFTP